MKQLYKYSFAPRPSITKTMPRKVSGYTLMEAVVYIAVLAVFSVIAVNAIIIILGSFRHLRAERTVNTAAQVSFERMVRDTRTAESITILQSTFDTNPGRLTLVNPDMSATEFYIENGTLKVRENGVYAGMLTASTTVVDTLVFRFINHGTVQGVRMELTLHDTRDPGVSRQFADTAVLRGTY
ncbi:MAG: prepilin-type N-terminal cleavage/methylation domain-containing protein [Patescibacteria group bacterium]